MAQRVGQIAIEPRDQVAQAVQVGRTKCGKAFCFRMGYSGVRRSRPACRRVESQLKRR